MSEFIRFKSTGIEFVDENNEIEQITSSGFIDNDGVNLVTSDIDSTDPDTGAFVVKGGVGINKNLNVGGSIQTNTITITSDVKYKSNIKPLSNPLNILDNVNCYSYTINNQNQYGVIAQEIKKIPELENLVSKNSNNDLSVNYINFIPLLIDSIKTLNQQIKNLKN